MEFDIKVQNLGMIYILQSNFDNSNCHLPLKIVRDIKNSSYRTEIKKIYLYFIYIEIFSLKRPASSKTFSLINAPDTSMF
jgi:hypothetical protein